MSDNSYDTTMRRVIETVKRFMSTDPDDCRCLACGIEFDNDPEEESK